MLFRRNTYKDLDPTGFTVDRELALRIAGGHRDALEQFLDRHTGPVYGYVVRRLGPGYEQLAARIVTATFDRALRNMKRYAGGRTTVPVRFRLLRIASKEVSRALRATPRPVASSTESEKLQELRGAIARLPARQQTLACLALYEAMPASNIAAVTGLSAARTMRVLRGALRRVHRYTEHATGEEPYIG